MSTTKGLKIALAVIAILFGLFVIYGFITDCPNTAGYFFCSESERNSLRD